MQVSENRLYYARRSEFERIAALQAPRPEWLGLYGDLARLNTLYMIAAAGSGHIGSSFSSLDIVSYLHRCEINRAAGDLYFSSKGHDVPALYAVLIAEGVLDEGSLHKLRRIDGLPEIGRAHV